MEKIVELIKNNFKLNDKNINIINLIFDRIKNKYSEKDYVIINDIIKYKLDFNSVCAYLICEYDISYQDIDDKDIIDLASNLKQLGNSQVSSTKQEETEILRKQFIAMCKDIRVIIIKLCLVLFEANSSKCPLTAQNRELLETIRAIYAPLSERLGLNKLKSELEDLCLKFLNPEIYEELKNNILLKQDENAKQIELTKNKIQIILNELGLNDAVIMSRQKHLSSVYKKIQTKNVSLAQIYDLIAMRVVVNTVEECYAVLGKIHGIYRPMEGRFKDYIANPKPNGYQSIHTTIIVENQRPLEIQIRTFDMHKNSEFGVDVAHWIYKEKRKKDDLDIKLSWLREIMDSAENLSSEEFVETLKTNLYSGRIFVQTPKGKVLEFPEGSCIIDFAYAIHSDIGNACVGGKINSKMMPLNTKMNNNDIVEIITSPTAKGPSRDWLKFVKTAGARSKINAFYKKELKDDNIKNGKQIMDLAVKNKGLSPSKVLDEKLVDKVLNRFAFNTADEMYAAVGYGSITSTQVLNRLIAEYEKINEEQIKQQKMTTITVRKNKDGVLVDGDSGMLVRYAGCCSPVLGEDIIGYISKGRGVTIHKCDCLNLKYLEQERLIKADWADKTSDFKICNLSVVALDSENMIIAITQTIANLHISIVSLETSVKSNKTVFSIKLKITQKDDIDKLLNNLKKIDKVIEVNK